MTMISILLSLIFILGAWYCLRLKRDVLRHIPGPICLPVIGNILQIAGRKPRFAFQKLQERYGDVYRVRMLNTDVVVVAGYDAIYEVLVRKGRQFSDRARTWRRDYLTEKTGITIMSPDNKWKVIRKMTHRHVKQFGDGMSKLEILIDKATHDMFETFSKNEGVPFDPVVTIRLATIGLITFLAFGQVMEHSDPLVAKLDRFERNFNHYMFVATPDFLLIDIFPFLVNFPLKPSKMLHEFKQSISDCWNDIKARYTQNSVVHIMLESMEQHKSNKPTSTIREIDACMSCLMLIEAAISTTSATFTCFINMLAHMQDIQENMHKEITAIDAEIMLHHRNELPYSRAVIFELLRFFTGVPSGVLHCALEDTEITGYGPIPKGTRVMTHLWCLHHNKAFWGDPDVFRPERFLDDSGSLLAADHPNRQHLLAFGAGPRVCIAETFALARLFLWATAVVRKFKVETARDSDPSWMDASVHAEDGTIKPNPSQVVFRSRDQG